MNRRASCAAGSSAASMCGAAKSMPCPSSPPCPKALQERCLAAPGLLAQIIVAKYCDHLPLYRQEQIYRTPPRRSPPAAKHGALGRPGRRLAAPDLRNDAHRSAGRRLCAGGRNADPLSCTRPRANQTRLSVGLQPPRRRRALRLAHQPRRRLSGQRHRRGLPPAPCNAMATAPIPPSAERRAGKSHARRLLGARPAQVPRSPRTDTAHGGLDHPPDRAPLPGRKRPARKPRRSAPARGRARPSKPSHHRPASIAHCSGSS